MSIIKGGNNIIHSRRVYEKDYVLEFHKGFVLTHAQYLEVDRLLNTHDFDAREKFLERHFPGDVAMVRGMIDAQKKLKREGYYDSK